MLKRPEFLSFLYNCFPFVREYRLYRKKRHRRLKMNRRLRLPKDDPKHLRRYVMLSGTIRRL